MHLKLLGLCRFFHETQQFFEGFEIPRTGASVIFFFFLIKCPNPVILLIPKIFKYPEPMVLSFCFFFSKYSEHMGIIKKSNTHPPHWYSFCPQQQFLKPTNGALNMFPWVPQTVVPNSTTRDTLC